MIGRQAARKTTNSVEEKWECRRSGQTPQRNNKDEKYRQQPVENDGCEINEPQNQYTQPERAPTRFYGHHKQLAAGFWARVLDADRRRWLQQPRSEWVGSHRPRHTAPISDVWMVLRANFGQIQPLPPLDLLYTECYVRRACQIAPDPAQRLQVTRMSNEF